MARSAWGLEAHDRPRWLVRVDTGLPIAATVDEPSPVLLEDAITVEYPADSESAHAGHVWD